MTQARGYRDVLEDLAAKITDGTYPSDTYLPTLPELRQIYGVSASTIQKALIVLEDRGMIEPRQGRGFYVCGPTTRK